MRAYQMKEILQSMPRLRGLAYCVSILVVFCVRIVTIRFCGLSSLTIIIRMTSTDCKGTF